MFTDNCLLNMQNKYLEEMLHELGLITRKVQAEFGALTVNEINWQPAAGQWSIAQCLDHLVKTNQQYFPVFESVSNGPRTRTFWESLPVLPGFFGKMMLKSLDPSNTKKLKSPAIFKPAASALPASIVSDFVRHQQELTRFLTATDQVNHEKIVVSSPVSSFITFSLKDCIGICVVHEERHFMQAKRIMKLSNFPKNSAAIF